MYNVVEQLWGWMNEAFPYNISECVDDNIYPHSMNERCHADKYYWFQDNINKNRRFRMLFVMMEEGNVKSLDRLHYLVSLITATDGFKHPIERIIAVYRKEDELQREVIGNKYVSVLS